jgi:glycosyltransferase involved in cell wall biosynthesis
MKQVNPKSNEANQRQQLNAIRSEDGIQVSVIIPAFNAAETIIRAIDSVRIQAIPGLEIIVINDGSSDDTAAIVAANIRTEENIRLIELESNSGVSAARNAGINVAKGMYLAFLDADDIWLPEKLRKQIDMMRSDDTIALVSCNSQLVTESGVPLKVGHVNRPPAEGYEAWKTLLIYNFLPTPTILTRTSLVKEIGGFDETLAVGEDLDLWIKIGLRGKIIVLKEILTNYYDRAGSLMKRHNEKTGSIVLPMLENHITAQGERLTASEVRYIRGCRSFQMGCNLYFSGSYGASIPIFWQAILNRFRPIKSLQYIPRALLMALFKRSFASGGKV